MKLLEFKNITIPDERSVWFVKLETEKEEELYRRMELAPEDTKAAIKAYEDWNALLKLQFALEDDDIFYYFMPDEKETKEGETFELDGIAFQRVL